MTFWDDSSYKPDCSEESPASGREGTDVGTTVLEDFSGDRCSGATRDDGDTNVLDVDCAVVLNAFFVQELLTISSLNVLDSSRWFFQFPE